jgi:hypothetical protein
MEKSYFFDSTADDRRFYNMHDLAKYHAQIIGNGVSNTASLPDLEVTARTNMEIALGAGYMFANGYMYENDSTMTLKHVIADPVNDRIDRVIIRFDNDPAERRIYAYIKQGVPAKSPMPPSLQRDEYIHEMSVAQVRIKAGKSFVEQSQITDERANDAVCGYIPLHNIYRGLQINEKGMVSMPNQSFFKATNRTPLQLNTSRITVPFGNVETDKQKEVKNNTTFKAKADGIYHFWIEFAWEQASGLTDVDVQVYLFVNGRESFPLAAKVLTNVNDNFVIQSGFDELKAGDEVTFQAVAFRSDKLPKTNFIRIRIVKTA